MKLNWKSFSLALLLLILLIVSSLLLIPKNYDTPDFVERENIQYWDLPTGSNIGFTLLKGEGDIKSYPIIYLHGGPGGFISSKIIKDLSPLTKEGFDVYLYDQLGSGHSKRLDDIKAYTAMRHQEDLEAIVEAIGAEKVILMGQSWGALLLNLFVADNADRVEKIILTGPGPVLPVQSSLAELTPPDSLNLMAPKFSNKEANDKMYNWRAKLTFYWAYILGRKLATDEEADQFFTTLNNELKKSTYCDIGSLQKSEAGGGYYAHIMTSKSFAEVKDERAKIKNNTIPTLILKGQCDNQKWGFTQEYLELYPNSRLQIIEKAGHDIAAENYTHYLQSIRDFLLEE